MPPLPSRRRLLSRLRQWGLTVRLAREAGWSHVGALALLAGLGSLLDIAGLGVGVSLLLGGAAGLPVPLPLRLSPTQGLLLLLLLLLIRAAAQVLVVTGQERLRSGFTDRLRQQLLSRVVHATSLQLEQLGRGELLGLLMSDIGRSVLALDQGLRALQALLALTLYAVGVVLVGRLAALPLLLALLTTGVAALLQRSGSWELGRRQTELNGALQRTVGDGLHGLKAVRAAAAEPWLLERFAHENALFRTILRQTVERQALFSALRDGLVVLVVGSWLVWGRAGLPTSAIATTLLLAYRTATSLSGVIEAQRLCLGSLPGYAELCALRSRLDPPPGDASPAVAPLPQATGWERLHWRSRAGGPRAGSAVSLRRGGLVVVAGPSGSGKTTLLDRFSGLLQEENSQWDMGTATGSRSVSGREGARELRRHLAYAPQDAVLFEGSLRENLLLGATGQPAAPSDAALAGWLEQLGLSHLLRREGGLDAPLNLALDCFSGGEIHRLGLLRAWLRDRPVEVLDEPTAFLDGDSAEQVRRIVLERSRQRLVLVSSHDPELIARADALVQLSVLDRPLAERQHHEQG